MKTQLYLNLPVNNLTESIAFFTKLGYGFNKAFTDETATCMIVSDTILVMLLTTERFQSFVKKPLGNAKQHAHSIIAISANSKDEVDALITKAIAAGAVIPNEPSDLGFMYSRIFEDLDGHLWEIFWMDPSGIPAQ